MKRVGLVLAVVALSLAGLAQLFTPASASAESLITSGPEVVYFSQTGHNLIFGFLKYWRENGGIQVFGLPVTEEVKEYGDTVQYFENGRLRLQAGKPEPENVTLGYLGQTLAAGRSEPYFQPLPAAEENENLMFFPQTGHTLAFDFLRFWQDKGGEAAFGKPISEELQEDGRTVQYFEQARFEYHSDYPDDSKVTLTPLGLRFAKVRGFDTSPKPPLPGAKEYSPSLWPKVIEVNLTTQSLVAYAGGQTVFRSLVSSGLYYPTPEGTYRIERKLVYDRMKGGTPGIDFYDLPNVPYVMYFYEGYSLHGTYWHNNFGHPMSHGCVNLPTPAAAWLFDWAPFGTLVVIHY
ncbi:MAG: L,D-transpeptidase [Chloroflexi bacterium]|nr:L,D-transpeptidase [Chloroflexota bacterium]